MRHFLRTGAAAGCMMLMAACTSETEITLPALDASQTRMAEALIAQGDSPSGFAGPAGVVRGGGAGAVAGMGTYMGGVLQSSGDGAVLGLLLAPIALPVSAVIGAAKAHPAEEVDAAMAAFREVGQDEELLASLDRRFLAALGAQAAPPWRCMEAMSTSMGAPCAGRLPAVRIRLQPVFSIESKGNWNPDIVFAGEVTAIVTLEDAAPGGQPELLLQAKWAHRRELGPFFELGRDGGAPLRRQLDHILDRFAARIAEDLYLAPRPQNLRRLETASRSRILPPHWDFVRIEQSPGELVPAGSRLPPAAAPGDDDIAAGRVTAPGTAPEPPSIATREAVAAYLEENRVRFDLDLMYYLQRNVCEQPCRRERLHVRSYEILEAGTSRVVLRLDYTYRSQGPRSASHVFMLDWRADRLVFVTQREA